MSFIGKMVEVQQLVNKPELNGARGVVKEFHRETGRFTVEVDVGASGIKEFKLKPENLRETILPQMAAATPPPAYFNMAAPAFVNPGPPPPEPEFVAKNIVFPS